MGLCDSRDQHHRQSLAKADVIDQAIVALPWPTLVRTLKTRLIKKPGNLDHLDTVIKRPTRKTFIDDVPYRPAALDAALQMTNRLRAISLVDMVIRLIMEDTQVHIDAILTFNEADFSDVCRRRRIQIL